MCFDAGLLYGDETDLKSGYKEEISSKVDDNIQF
jgi:hypothetical protein